MSEPIVKYRATVTRRAPIPATELVDQVERQLQAEHYQAVESAALAANEPATGAQAEPALPKPRPDQHGLQSAFLAGNLGKPVTVFTLNGIKLVGKLRQFDQFMLLLQGLDGLDSLIFKHAITTVMSASVAPGKQRQPARTNEVQP